jgi:hypothetical protein
LDYTGLPLTRKDGGKKQEHPCQVDSFLRQSIRLEFSQFHINPVDFDLAVSELHIAGKGGCEN